MNNNTVYLFRTGKISYLKNLLRQRKKFTPYNPRVVATNHNMLYDFFEFCSVFDGNF